MTLQAATTVLAMLVGVLVHLPAAHAATTPTGVQVEQRCSKVTRDAIDKLNRQPVRAMIHSASCRPDGTLEKVRLRALEGGDLRWTADEGMEELSRRMKQGK
jgi:hypothetical protein